MYTCTMSLERKSNRMCLIGKHVHGPWQYHCFHSRPLKPHWQCSMVAGRPEWAQCQFQLHPKAGEGIFTAAMAITWRILGAFNTWKEKSTMLKLRSKNEASKERCKKANKVREVLKSWRNSDLSSLEVGEPGAPWSEPSKPSHQHLPSTIPSTPDNTRVVQPQPQRSHVRMMWDIGNKPPGWLSRISWLLNCPSNIEDSPLEIYMNS